MINVLEVVPGRGGIFDVHVDGSSCSEVDAGPLPAADDVCPAARLG